MGAGDSGLLCGNMLYFTCLARNQKNFKVERCSLKHREKFMLRIQGRAIMEKVQWLLCPVCGNKTRLQIRRDTELKNFPLYCPKCKQETMIDVKDLTVIVQKDRGR